MFKMLSLCVLLSMTLVEPLYAQEGASARQRGRAGRAADPALAGDMRLSPADVMNVLDGYALVQAQEALQLGEAQYGSFVTRLKKLQETRRRNQQGRVRLLQELRKLTSPQAAETDENAIRQRIKALQDHDDRSADEVRKAYSAIDEVLDARQQARFRLFEERLEMRKIDLLMRARQAAARRQNR